MSTGPTSSDLSLTGVVFVTSNNCLMQFAMAAIPGIDPAWRWKQQQPAEPKPEVLPVNNRVKVNNREKQAKWRASHPDLNRQRARDGMRRKRAELKANA